MLLSRSRRNLPGLLHTRSHAFQAPVRRRRPRKRLRLLVTSRRWMRSLLRRLKAPPRLPKKMSRITSQECPSPWMRHQRSKPFPFMFVVPRSYLQGELLGQSWICSYQATPRTSRRSPLGDDTNLQHLLGYSLVAGSPLQNLPEMKVVRRWRKLPGSSSFQDHLWLRMSLPLRKLLRMYRLRLLPQLRRRRRRTRSGRCARSCETPSRCL